jgi:hypothetical protein
LYFKDAWKRSISKKAAKRVIEVKGREVVHGVEGLIGEPTKTSSNREGVCMLNDIKQATRR